MHNHLKLNFSAEMSKISSFIWHEKSKELLVFSLCASDSNFLQLHGFNAESDASNSQECNMSQ